MDLRLHFLEAAGSLDRWRARMEAQARAVSDRVDALIDEGKRRHPVDVVVRTAKWGVVPELGLGGSCYEASLVTIQLAPQSSVFETSMENGDFASTLAHELHHAIRHASIGYGSTLGEALVSEGLADRFSVEVTGCRRPIWSEAEGVDAELVDAARRQARDAAYDHPAWFFGEGKLPRWAGYTIGWRLIEAYLAKHPDQTAGALANVRAGAILGETLDDRRAGPIPLA